MDGHIYFADAPQIFTMFEIRKFRTIVAKISGDFVHFYEKFQTISDIFIKNSYNKGKAQDFLEAM